METERDPHDDADALLHQWGSNWELINLGLFPHTQEGGEEEIPPEKVQTSGYTNPTAGMAMRRRHLLFIDAAVNRLPRHWYDILAAQYVRGLSDREAAEEAGRDRKAWARERDAARMLFYGHYQEAKRAYDHARSEELQAEQVRQARIARSSDCPPGCSPDVAESA